MFLIGLSLVLLVSGTIAVMRMKGHMGHIKRIAGQCKYKLICTAIVILARALRFQILEVLLMKETYQFSRCLFLFVKTRIHFVS